MHVAKDFKDIHSSSQILQSHYLKKQNIMNPLHFSNVENISSMMNSLEFNMFPLLELKKQPLHNQISVKKH